MRLNLFLYFFSAFTRKSFYQREGVFGARIFKLKREMEKSPKSKSALEKIW